VQLWQWFGSGNQPAACYSLVSATCGAQCPAPLINFKHGNPVGNTAGISSSFHRSERCT